MEILRLLERTRATIQPGRERMRRALDELGLDTQTLPPSLLIGGTNGKGSTAGSLWRLLALAGIRCGLYTSPHILHFSERIQISDRTLSMEDLEDELAALRTRLSPELEESLSFFELTTVLALTVFKRYECELMILEVGIGGRWDATNTVEPIASAIVSIDYDHQEFLGHTLDAIAKEKLGLARRGKALFWGERLHEAVLEATLNQAQHECPFILHRSGHAFGSKGATGFVHLPGLEDWSYPMPTWFEGRAPILKQNFSVAVAIFYSLVHEDFLARSNTTLLPIQRAHAALTQFSNDQGPWPPSFFGRLQRLHIQGSSAKTWDFYLDVCHNIASVREFVRTLEELGLVIRNRKKIAGFVSILRDKDLEPMIMLLREVLDPFVIFKIDNVRSITEDQLTKFHDDVVLYDDFADLWNNCADHIHSPVAICGSFYAVGRVLEYFKAYPQGFSAQSTLHATDPRSLCDHIHSASSSR